MRRDVLRLAADAEVDPRTAAKAIDDGTGDLKSLTRARIERSAKRLAIQLGSGTPVTSTDAPR